MQRKVRWVEWRWSLSSRSPLPAICGMQIWRRFYFNLFTNTRINIYNVLWQSWCNGTAFDWKRDDCGLNSHSGEWIYFRFLTLLKRQSLTLSSALHHPMSCKLSERWWTECLNTSHHLPCSMWDTRESIYNGR